MRERTLLTPGPARFSGKLFVIGGETNLSLTGPGIATVETIDLTAAFPVWTPAPSLLQTRYGHGAAVIGGRIYVAGGITGAGAGGPWTVEFLDVAAGATAWTLGPNLTSIRSSAAVAALAAQGRLLCSAA